MPNKAFFFILSFLIMLPAMLPLLYFFLAPETRVCGFDNKNYPNLDYAQKNKIQISYDFPCEDPKTEEGLYERRENIDLAAQLISFDAQKNILYIKSNFDQQNYFVNLNLFFNHDYNIDYFLPGDQLKIQGEINKNTQIIEASNLSNLTIEKNNYTLEKCEIMAIATTLQCGNKVYRVDESSKILAGLKNNASLVDLKIGDKVVLRSDGDMLKTLLVAQRGNLQYLKNYIYFTSAKVKDINNNLLELSSENKIIQVSMDDNTRLVKKYFGILEAVDIKIGDSVEVVAKENQGQDDTLIMLKNNSVWK